jgi:hypothetical protein
MTPPLLAADGSALAPSVTPFAAPAAWFFDLADALRVTSFNGQAAVTIAIEGRFLNEDGSTSTFRFSHTPNTDRSSKSDTFTMGNGWLVGLQVRATAGTPRRGQCFVLVEVVRGSSTSQESLGALLQGYVTTTMRLAWPGSAIVESASGPGALRSITGTDPAANVEISETVPTNARWRVLGVLATLVTDANAATREASLTIDDGTTVVARYPAGQSQILSLTTRYLWAAAGARFPIVVDRTIVVPIADVWLPDGYRLKTVTQAIQVTDNWSAPQLWVEELIED